MRRLIVVATLVLATTGTAGADSKRCAAEQQAVRADKSAILVDAASLHAVNAQIAAAVVERAEWRREANKTSMRIALNTATIDQLQRRIESCRSESHPHCKALRAALAAAQGRLDANTALLAEVEAQIAALNDELDALSAQQGRLDDAIDADHAQLALDRDTLEACQAG